MEWLANLLRRARLRGLVDGRVQTVRAESLENQAHDDAERHQDYGFAAHPVDGQGLVLHVGGHTIVLRMDRIAERPELDAFEVAVWHHEGHMVKLKAGRVVEVTCDHLVVNASADVTINTPVMTVNATDHVELATPLVHASTDMHVDGETTLDGNVAMNADAHLVGTLTADVDVVGSGTHLHTHQHGFVKTGTDTSGTPV